MLIPGRDDRRRKSDEITGCVKPVDLTEVHDMRLPHLAIHAARFHEAEIDPMLGHAMAALPAISSFFCGV
jgi:hypothetical protein